MTNRRGTTLPLLCRVAFFAASVIAATLMAACTINVPGGQPAPGANPAGAALPSAPATTAAAPPAPPPLPPGSPLAAPTPAPAPTVARNAAVTSVCNGAIMATVVRTLGVDGWIVFQPKPGFTGYEACGGGGSPVAIQVTTPSVVPPQRAGHIDYCVEHGPNDWYVLYDATVSTAAMADDTELWTAIQSVAARGGYTPPTPISTHWSRMAVRDRWGYCGGQPQQTPAPVVARASSGTCGNMCRRLRAAEEKVDTLEQRADKTDAELDGTTKVAVTAFIASAVNADAIEKTSAALAAEVEARKMLGQSVEHFRAPPPLPPQRSGASAPPPRRYTLPPARQLPTDA